MESRPKVIEELMRGNPRLMICPSCGDRMRVESETARNSASYYVAERSIKCGRCGLKIRQYVYMLRG
ncbi:hypothetical protein GCM10007981_19240 [Thermocladium modestius]|uniref:Uncharacterized protein n=1 Tax=Thermocladium modestius TaxID=62609 RepID=A0A830GXM0_9CREN|nr:hypothetical protein [Thermocladium modestius]GGP22584.1 hypothetical protein GCM10007981_19240 [Thermocladium modestius]